MITRVILYVRDIPKVAAFYERHFGMQRKPTVNDGWLELGSPDGGCDIALHIASVAQKSGSAAKIVFGVADVPAFVKERAAAGLEFGVTHRIDGFTFSNARDPAGNSIQISSR